MDRRSQHEEVTLVDIVVIWIRSWRSAVLIGFLVGIVGTIVVASLDDRYDSQVKLLIGRIAEDEFLQTPEVLVQQLRLQYRVGDDTQGPRLFPRIEKISFDKRSNSPVVTFVARANTSDEAVRFLNQVVEDLEAIHLKKYQKIYAAKEELKTQLEELIDKHKTASAKTGGSISEAAKTLVELQQEIQLMQMTAALSSPTRPNKPASPKRTILYILVLGGAITLSLFLPFFISFYQAVREELSKSVDSK